MVILTETDLALPVTPRRQALDISCYSFTMACRRTVSLLRPSGSLLTHSHIGAEKWILHYSVMGLAKAALDAIGEEVRYGPATW